MRHYNAPPPGGQDMRKAVGNWERATNRQQKAIVKVYDAWGTTVRRELNTAAAGGADATRLARIIDRHLPALESQLLKVTEQGIQSAARISVGSLSTEAVVTETIKRQIAENAKLVKGSLVPKARESILANIAKLDKITRRTLVDAFLPMRSATAQYAGGYWVAIFEVQKSVGRQMELQSGQDMPVRWVLEAGAEHCETCMMYAGEYPNWDSLPTVPAGDVLCRGNCRCHLEVFIDGQWRRGVV